MEACRKQDSLMNYKIKLVKSTMSTDAQFGGAVACAKDSVESVLFDNESRVTLTEDTIKVELAGEGAMTLGQLKDKVRGCFQDSSGSTYPEFKFVEIE